MTEYCVNDIQKNRAIGEQARKTGTVTLHIEGRDLTESVEKAIQFDRETCRWVILGEAAEVQRSNERTRVLSHGDRDHGKSTARE
jgi:hypothetical protein